MVLDLSEAHALAGFLWGLVRTLGTEAIGPNNLDTRESVRRAEKPLSSVLASEGLLSTFSGLPGARCVVFPAKVPPFIDTPSRGDPTTKRRQAGWIDAHS